MPLVVSKVVLQTLQVGPLVLTRSGPPEDHDLATSSASARDLVLKEDRESWTWFSGSGLRERRAAVAQ